MSKIPFQTYFPTFDKMNEYQLKFYFFWRNEVIKDNYIETDLSYIFLFAYELINYSFNENAWFNVSMLEKLYKNYVKKYPKLKSYLPNWIVDLLLELNEVDLASEWIDIGSKESKEYEELKEYELRLKKISMTIWRKYISNQPLSNFFDRNKQTIYKEFKEAMVVLEGYLLKQNEQKGLFEHLFESKEVEVYREFFSSAIIYRKAPFKKIKIKKKVVNRDFSVLLYQLLLVSENITREKMGLKEKLEINNSVITKELEEMIYEKTMNLDKKSRFVQVSSSSGVKKGEVIPKKIEEVKEIKLNFEKINELNKDSDDLQKIFIEKYRDEEIEDEDYSPSENIKREKVINFNDMSENVEQDVSNMFLSNEIEDEDVGLFLEKLTVIEREFLVKYKNETMSITETRSFLKAKGIMFGNFLLDLNEKSEECLGDILFEELDDELEINEDFEVIFEKL